MNEEITKELQDLTALESAGTLEEAQKPRLALLRALEQAEKTAEQKSKDLESALAQKEHFREKHEKEEAARKALEEKLNKPKTEVGQPPAAKSLEVGDYIDISASLEGLDQREKEYLAEQHKLTGRPLKEIRSDENFLLWQGAYRAKVEKEKALKPTGGQPEANAPKSATQRLKELNSSGNFLGNLKEQEKILTETGLYKPPRGNPYRSPIGHQ